MWLWLWIAGCSGEKPVEPVVVPKPEPIPVAAEVPCQRGYSATTQVSVQRREAVVKRFHETGDRDTVVVPFERLTRIEHRPDGACPSIWLHRTDAAPLLFEDGETATEARTESLSRLMGFSDQP